jgi:hypothetical protein
MRRLMMISNLSLWRMTMTYNFERTTKNFHVYRDAANPKAPPFYVPLADMPVVPPPVIEIQIEFERAI